MCLGAPGLQRGVRSDGIESTLCPGVCFGEAAHLVLPRYRNCVVDQNGTLPVEQLELREDVRDRVAEISDRIDFAERMLTKGSS